MSTQDRDLAGSTIAESAALHENVRVLDSVIGPHCSIGSDSNLRLVTMEESAKLGYRNTAINVKIGRGTYTKSETVLRDVQIGRFCNISWQVSIGGRNHPMTSAAISRRDWLKRVTGVPSKKTRAKTPGPYATEIGNDVWIAAGVNIIEGVHIGNGSIIGGGAW